MNNTMLLHSTIAITVYDDRGQISHYSQPHHVELVHWNLSSLQFINKLMYTHTNICSNDNSQ